MQTQTIDFDRREIQFDRADRRQFQLLAALLDHDTPPWRPDVVPPLGHWLLFPPLTRQSGIGEDGHPARDAQSLLPDVGLPRRMWAGSRIEFLRDIPVDAALRRESRVLRADFKEGKSGRMLFVTVKHEIHAEGALAIAEEQDIVYREAQPAAVARPPGEADTVELPPVCRTMRATTSQLLRFSAITFNAHRIHYDRPYAMAVEGYPALIVHGPYLATLLMDHFLRYTPGATVRRYRFRAERPVFDDCSFTLGMAAEDGGASLMVIGADGARAMSAAVEI